MRAKNEYKFIEEAYTQVNEGFDDVGKGPVHRAAARGARPRDPDKTALGKAFLASQTAEGPPNPGPDDLGPDRSEEPETHKPYVSSYMPFHRDEDDKLKPSKKIWAVLDQDGNAIFTSNDKDEAYKWFDDNFKDLRDEGEEFDKEEDYWTLGLTDEDKIKDHGPVIKKDLLTPEEEKKIDANREKLHASKVKSSFGKKRWE
jgi:hypothetical protein